MNIIKHNLHTYRNPSKEKYISKSLNHGYMHIDQEYIYVIYRD